MADNNNNQQETARAVYPLMDISSFPPLALPQSQKRGKGSGYDFDSYSVDLLARSNSTLAGAVHVGAIFDMLREVLIPTIDSETRNWYVGNIDTGVKAEGKTPTFRYFESEENGEEKPKRVLQVGYYETNDKGEKVFSGAQDLLDIDALVPYFAWIKLDASGRVDEAGGELWLTYTLGGVTYKLIAADRLKLRFSDLTPEDIAVLQAPVKAVVADAWAALERANAAAQTAEDAAALATGAVAEADAATSRANTAATNANNAAALVTAAVLDIAAEKQAAIDAAAAANTAAGNADTATQNANTAATAANTAKANADAAATAANNAASAANTAKANTDAATTAANDAAAAATTAKTNADAAAQGANDAASAANTAKTNADAATTAANNAATAANTAKTNADAATTSANNAADKATKAAQHPPVIDATTTNWKIWDADSDAYTQTSYPSRGGKGDKGDKGDNAHSPRIKSATSTWEVYDDTAKQYVDTGVQVNTTYTLTADGIKTALGYTPANSDHTHNYAAASHTHDDRYYTETEIDSKLNGKAASNHTHDYAPTSHTHDTYVTKNSLTFEDIKDGADVYLDAGTVVRRTIVRRTKNAQGYISRVAIGLTNPSGQFSPATISVGLNDQGTQWRDFIFNPNGSFSATSFVKEGGTKDQLLLANGGVKELSSLSEDYIKKDGSNGTADGVSALVRTLGAGDSNVTDNTLIITSHITPSDTNNQFYRRPASFFWNYIKSKGGANSGLDADLLDGEHLSGIRAVGYAMQSTFIDVSNLDVDTWYPVTMSLGCIQDVLIAVIISLDSGTIPPWSTHSTGGFSVRKIWKVNGNGYGTTHINRTIYASDSHWTSTDPVRGIGQMGNSSNEYVYVRGGGKYRFITSHGVVPALRTSTYTNNGQSVSPTTTMPAAITRTNALISDNVASATKLQSARTLTIGNTGKTFNGEGNVAWSLAEIGAAPLGANAVTALNAVPIDKPLVIATINSATAQTFGLANTTVPAGREIHVIINNTSSAALAIAIPSAGVYKNCIDDASITIDAGKFGEISAVSNGTNIFLRAIGS